MSAIPQIECSLQEAHAQTDGDRLIVSTGRVQRIWQWTDAGFATRHVLALDSGRIWKSETAACDWQLPDGTEPVHARLVNLSADVRDDEGFTSEHVCVEAEIAYLNAGFCIKFTIWIYPGARGIRTQLAARLLDEQVVVASTTFQGAPKDARVDCVPLGDSSCQRRFFGYYNETQRRNDTHQNILKEEVITHPLMGREWCDWASVACVEDGDGGIALVKESHKCVNQHGHATGGFVCDDREGLSCTGWGLLPSEASREAFTAGWATWCLVWTGGDLDRALTFKTFDRVRYPIDPERDVYIQANTWGSTDNSSDARRAAIETSVLREIETCAELGIDVLQIDDGWQVPPGHTSSNPEENGWYPHPECYPNGWKNVRSLARELGVKLGLWAAAMPVGLDELKANYTEGGFVQYKLDFANLRNRGQIDDLMQKVRAFIAWTHHRVRVNWDVTENPPRYGYFFAREYGCIYLENRKPVRPVSTVYRPHTVLRDLWQVSKYLNLHRFQCSIQNVDLVDPEQSDAVLHSHAYATAIALMGIPLFFQETKYYTDRAKEEIRAILDVYKAHREAIYKGIVHPIGDKPDNASWTGFQCHLMDEDRGYLMIFRERCNADSERSLRLGWLPHGSIQVTDLLKKTAKEMVVDADGTVIFRIDQAADFLFLQYGMKKRTRDWAIYKGGCYL